MFDQFEVEKTVLQMAFLTSALKKAIKNREKKHDEKRHHEAMVRGKKFISSILAGTLLLPREERQQLLPEGIWLNESVLAYNYARKAWAVANIGAPRSDEETLEKLRSYVGCFQELSQQKPLEEWSSEQASTRLELLNFIESLEDVLAGELYSERAESMSCQI